jgi:hypothetical protein
MQDPPQVGQIRACQVYAGQPPELTGSLNFEQALLIIFDPLNGKRGNVEMTDFNKYQSRNVKFRNPNVRIQHNVKFQIDITSNFDIQTSEFNITSNFNVRIQHNVKFQRQISAKRQISFPKNLNARSREIPIEMAKKKLRSGKGAKAQVLTRFIKPTQPLPGHDKKASSRDRTASWTLS